MNIKQIQSFIAVADTKSFSEAAKWMYTSVSQISKLVKGLEDDVGYILFERKKNGILLTPEGMKIYNVANKVLRDIDELEFIKERNGKESLIVLGLPDVLMDNVFIEYIEKQKDKNMFYNLSNRSIENISNELHVRKADMGFAYIEKRRKTAIKMRLNDYALRFAPICKVEKYLFVNSKHPLAKMPYIENEKLKKTEQIKINGTDFLKAEQRRSTHDSMFAVPTMKMLTYSMATVIKVIEESNMAYIGCDVFNEIKNNKNIARVPLMNDDNEVEFGYIKRHNVEMSEIAYSFLRHIENKI